MCFAPALKSLHIINVTLTPHLLKLDFVGFLDFHYLMLYALDLVKLVSGE
jgi:hypothetical protein